MSHSEHDPQDEDARPVDSPEEAEAKTGAEGGEHEEGAPVPFAPHSDDDSPLGDTDQHSDA